VASYPLHAIVFSRITFDSQAVFQLASLAQSSCIPRSWWGRLWEHQRFPTNSLSHPGELMALRDFRVPRRQSQAPSPIYCPGAEHFVNT
jgi:hypothetical protein